MKKQISWLHLSDLHVFSEADTILILDAYKKLAEEIHPKFIIISGDYRDIDLQPSFEPAMDYINLVLEAFGLKKADVYMVPGGHDVNEFDKRNDVISDICKQISNNYNCYAKYMTGGPQSLLNAFNEYTGFVKKFYEGSGVSDDRVSNPAQVFCSTWKNKINIIHVNSSLISDQSKDHGQILDLNRLIRCPIKNPNAPIIAIGHYHYQDMEDSIAKRFNQCLEMRGVRAYLCGSEHKLKESSIKQSEPYETIPCISCPKSAPESGDKCSDIGVVYYTWSPSDGKVYMEAYGWNAEKQKDFFPMPEFTYGAGQKKYFDIKSTSEQRRKISTTDEINETIEENSIPDQNRYVDAFGLKAFQADKAYTLGRALIMQRADVPENRLMQTHKRALLDYCDIISDSKKKYPLIIEGLPGTGKSTLLTLLYLTYLQTNKSWSFLIDLHKLDYMKYSEAKNEIEGIISYIDESISRQTRIVLFIDGLNQFKRHHVGVERLLRGKMAAWKNEDGIQFVCAIGIQDANRLPRYSSNGFETIFSEFEKKIVLSPTYVYSKSFSMLVKEVLSVYEIHLDQDGVNKLKTQCTIIDEKTSTFRTILFLAKEYITRGNDLFNTSVGKILLEHYSHRFGSNLLKIASKTSDIVFYNKTIENNELNVNTIKGPASFEFLFAYYYFNLCLNNNINKAQEYNRIFPAKINRFIIQLVQMEPKKEKNFIRRLMKWFDDPGFSIKSKAQMVYFIGRKKHDDEVKADAVRFLSEKYYEIQENYENSQKSMEEIMLLRSIGISLLYLGYKDHENDFYSLMIYDEAMNKINRDFHVAYYTDNAYKISEESIFDKDIIYSRENVKNEYNILFHSIKENKDPRTRPLNIITIISLVLYWVYGLQNDQENNSKDKELFNGFGRLLDRLSSCQELPDIIKDYIETVKNNIKEKNVYVSALYKLYRFKNIKRKGWKDRGINNYLDVESDADHTWACCILASILLPDNVRDCELIEKNELNTYKGYDKQKIIRLLLAHDLPECLTGDIPSPEKGDANKDKEKKAIDKIEALGAFPFLSPLYNIAEECREFMTRDDKKASINVRIASDIDKLEPLIQLYLYRQYLTPPCDYSQLYNWTHNREFRLHTSFGQNLFKLLNDYMLNEESFRQPPSDEERILTTVPDSAKA